MRYNVLVILFALCSESFSQNFSPNEQLSQASYFQWTGENALISNNITSSLQAKSGFIWVTTYNGIMRFDGTRVDVFDRSTLPFLATDAFYKVYEDSIGNLWFTSQGSGLVKYENFEFKKIEPENDSLPKSIRCILIEKNGALWVGSNSQGLYKIENNHLQKIHHANLDNIGIMDLKKDDQGNLWIATDGNGLVRFNEKEFVTYTEKEGLFSNSLNTLEIVPDGSLFIGTTKGLNIYKNNKILQSDFLKNIPINYIITDKLDQIWIGAENGLGRINRKTNRKEFVSEETGLPYARINTISFDYEGSTWVSTGRNGLIQIKQTGIINITTRQGLSFNRINVITQAVNEVFYIGTDDGNINSYHHGQIESIPIKTKLYNAGIRDIHVDADGTFWIASYQGILKIKNNKEQLLTSKDGLPADDFRRIIKDQKGRYWFGSRSGGVAQHNGDRTIRTYNKGNGLKSNYVLSLEEGPDGRIYVGTHSGGLTIINNDGTSTTHHVTQNDAGILIFNIHINSPDSIYVVCNTGPYFFNGKEFQSIDLQISSKGETYFDWIKDDNGNIWITTNIGVLRILKNDLHSFLKGEIQKVPTKLFDKQDGMNNKECTGATRSTISNTGNIWIPTVGGIAIFFPDMIKENKVVPPVYVTSVAIDDEVISKNLNITKINIPQGNLRTTIRYTSLSYFSPSKVSFKYKLSGIDRQWVAAGSQREAEYTNLPPGNYTFSVVASNNDGLWNETGDQIELVVIPYVYQTTWFKITITLLLVISLYIFYKWRVHRIEKRNAELNKLNEELDRFVYSTSHDLRAPLASIMGLVNLYRLEKENKDQYINLIEKSVVKLDQFIGEIIDYSRNARLELEIQPIEFKTLLETLLDNLKYLDEQNRIAKHIVITGSGNFNTDNLRLKIILNNLISNALKYSNLNQENPEVTIKIEYGDEKAFIQIIDNGIGINERHLPNIFKMFYRGSDNSRGSGLGLYIVKETVDKLNGTIEVISTLGKGSIFSIHLPSLKTTKG